MEAAPTTATSVTGERRGAQAAVWTIRTLLFPAIVVGVFFGVLPRIANLDQVWAQIRGLTGEQAAILAALTVLNIVTYWPMLVAAMPGLRLGQAAVVCQTSTSVAMTLPAGGALAVGVSYAMYSSWGFTGTAVARSAMATFFANMSFKLVLPAVALLLLLVEGDADGGLPTSALLGLTALVAGIVVVSLLLRDERFARRAGSAAQRRVSRVRRLVGRSGPSGWGDAAARFRREMVGLLRERGLLLGGSEVVSQLAVFSVFFSSIRFSGINQVTVPEALAVFAFVRLASALPIIPGNVGLAELGYIGALGVAGAHDVQSVAAVLVFRFLTYFLQIPLGGITYLVWRRNTRWRASVHVPGEQEQAPEEARAVHDAADHERRDGLVEQTDHGHEERPGVPATNQH